MSNKRKKWFIDDSGRQCRLCAEYKTWSKFCRNAGNTTGYANICKLCKKTDPKQIAARRRRRRNSRKNQNIHTRIKENLRCRIRHAIYRRGSKGHKGGSFTRSVGCSTNTLLKYLESKFYSNPETGEPMTWENYGFGDNKWHIDHIIPLSKFDLSNPRHFKQATHYTNLQPMWQKENFKKKDKVPKHLKHLVP